jgi:hypothetical protein
MAGCPGTTGEQVPGAHCLSGPVLRLPSSSLHGQLTRPYHTLCFSQTEKDENNNVLKVSTLLNETAEMLEVVLKLRSMTFFLLVMQSFHLVFPRYVLC